MKKLFSYFFMAFAVLATSISSAIAATTPIDYSALTDAIDVSSVSTAIMTIAAALMGLYLAIFGVRKVIGMVRSG